MTNTTFRKALLVIDMQENLVKASSRIHIDISNVDQLFQHVNQTIELFEQEGLPVLYITNEWSNVLVNWITGNACKKGGRGVGPDPRLRRVNRKLYRKSAKSAFINTEVLKDLQDWKVSEIVLVGLFAEHCVKATMLDALRNDFRVTIITDALGSKNENNLSRSLQYYQSKGATLVSAEGWKDINRNRITA